MNDASYADEYSPMLVERIGEFGIFKTFLGTYSVANMVTEQICSRLNIPSLEEAREYISEGVEYIPQI